MLCNSWVSHRSESWWHLLVSVLMQGLFLRVFHSPLPLPSLENSLRRAAGICLQPGKLKVQFQAQPNFPCQLHFSQLLSCPLGLEMQDAELPVLSLCQRHVPLLRNRLIQGSCCLLCLQRGAGATEALTQSPGPPLHCLGPALGSVWPGNADCEGAEQRDLD